MAESGIISDKEFVRLISDQASYVSNDLQQIERLLEKYPYCQAFHYIHSSILKKTQSDQFDTLLQKAAVYSPSRDVLYQYVEQPREVKRIFFDQQPLEPETINNLSAYEQEKAALLASKTEALESVDNEQSLLGDLIPRIAESENVNKNLQELAEKLEEEPSLELTEKEELVYEDDDEIFEEISEAHSTENILVANQEIQLESAENLNVDTQEESLSENDLENTSDLELSNITSQQILPDAETVTPPEETIAVNDEIFEEISEVHFVQNEAISTELKPLADQADDELFEEISEVNNYPELQNALLIDALQLQEPFTNEVTADETDDQIFDEIAETEALHTSQVVPIQNINVDLEAINETQEYKTEVNDDEDEIFDEINEIESTYSEESSAVIIENHEVDKINFLNEEKSLALQEEYLPGDVLEEKTVEKLSITNEEIEVPQLQINEFEENVNAELNDANADIADNQHIPLTTNAPASVFTIADEIETVIPEHEWPDFKFSDDWKNEITEDKEPEFAVLENAEKLNLNESSDSELPVTTAQEVAQEKLIVDSIASSDYFIFDKSAVDPLQADETKHNKADNDLHVVAARHDANDVSKYHDDTMPFTFLWWLHKTRKEHEIYQPYTAKSSKKVAVTEPVNAELNQQIIESIFHHQPQLNSFPADAQPVVTPALEVLKKGDELIERFIKEDPQIKPPLANKLDTENKARKSSEDNLDMVSETLARIYIDQMLYHKAIDTYKKLSLKYPEKSTYFAGQISDLEKKIN